MIKKGYLLADNIVCSVKGNIKFKDKEVKSTCVYPSCPQIIDTLSAIYFGAESALFNDGWCKTACIKLVSIILFDLIFDT